MASVEAGRMVSGLRRNAMKSPQPMMGFAMAIAALTGVRIVVLFVSPLELYPDEAQYWLWSRHLALGYFSKPPMIAWLIRASTAIGGQTEPWVRLSAPILHGLTAVFLALAGRRLYGVGTGIAGGAIYSLCPGVQLSCAVIATDAPLMTFLALSLWAYAAWWTARDARAIRLGAAGFGLALGAAMLAKYAALYFLAGALAHGLLSRRARERWRVTDLALAISLMLLVISPNVLWNVTHHFQTLAHTAADANLGEDARPQHWFDPRGGLGYVAGQFGVFGPIPFAVFLGGVALLWRRRSATPEDGVLIAFAAPPLLIVLVEAVISRANANWAGAAYGPAAILVAALLLRWRPRRLLDLALGSQLLMAAIFMVVFAAPVLADHVGFANSFKRARGWAASTRAIEAAANAANRGVGVQPLSAVAVDDRFLFNALAYYGRDNRNHPAARLGAPLKMWVREAKPHNQAETAAPLTALDGRRVLIANAMPNYRREIMADFTKIGARLTMLNVRLDGRHDRTIALFIGEAFRRQPRDLVTGRPRVK